MSSLPTVPGPIPVPEESPVNAAAKTKKQKAKHHKAKQQLQRPKPARTLPTDRISVAKQLDILRGYAAASSKGTKPATTSEAAEIVGLSPATVAMANAFLASIGLIKRADTGSFVPCQEVVSFLAAYEWDQKTAGHKLAPRLKESWFCEALLPRILFDAVDEKVALNVLAEAASVGPQYEKELRIVLEFMAASGIIQRDGGLVRLLKPVQAEVPRAEDQKAMEPENTRATRVATSYASQAPGGGIDFNISVHVDMGEFGNWRPERIQAFFRGIAEVLAAKADIEKGGVGS